MTAKVREAWSMYERGWPPRRIARAIGLSVNTIRWRLECAKRELGVPRPCRATDVEVRAWP